MDQLISLLPAEMPNVDLNDIPDIELFKKGIKINLFFLYYTVIKNLSIAMDLDFIAPDWSMSLTIDESTINEKVQQIILKASNLQGDNRISSLVKAITCIDLTTLRGDDTESKVEFLCKKVNC